MECLRALASPVAWVRFAPLPDTLYVHWAAEVISVVRFLMPATLAGDFPHVAARGLGAVALTSGAARVGIKKALTVLTLALTQWTSHGPASPQAHDQGIAA